MTYDKQLAAIEQSLKGKQHDYEELRLLDHDATHAITADQAHADEQIDIWKEELPSGTLKIERGQQDQAVKGKTSRVDHANRENQSSSWPQRARAKAK